MIVINIDQNSESWHANRLGRITGTRFKSLMMGEKTAGYQGLISEVACEILTGEAVEGPTTKAMENGKETEDEARQEYELHFGPVEQVGFVIPDADNEFAELIGVSPDGLIMSGLATNDGTIWNGGLEIKCPLPKTHLEYISEGLLPDEYRHQVQASLFVTGLPYWDFISYVPNMKPFIFRELPDKELHKQYTERLRKFTAEVKKIIDTYQKYEYLK